LYLLLDGVLVAEVDGDEVAEIGPGAIVGERAFLERGKRTATLSARTPCRVAVIPAELIDRQELEDLAASRHGEIGPLVAQPTSSSEPSSSMP
ncbi:MAG: cyclic nucleotide-binding domain-containing protein, partial [Gaiellaceae bacterium]